MTVPGAGWLFQVSPVSVQALDVVAICGAFDALSVTHPDDGALDRAGDAAGDEPEVAALGGRRVGEDVGGGPEVGRGDRPIGVAVGLGDEADRRGTARGRRGDAGRDARTGLVAGGSLATTV